MTPRRIALAVCLIVALLVLLRLALGSARVVNDPEDLRAFYCAGQTIATHHDPYRAEPLRTCEDRAIARAGLTPVAGLAVPAPLPPYAFVPFELLGLLDFAVASQLYVLLLAAALGATVVCVARLTRAPLLAVFAALALGDGVGMILNGQLLSFALLALCASAYALANGKYAVAGVAAAVAAIEPHVAGPALLALFFCVPRTRLAIALSLASLAVVALVVGGPASIAEYLTAVLPAHVRSEAGAAEQYSLTSLLVHLGAAREVAVAIGNVQYVAFVAFGIAVASRLDRLEPAPELYALLPPAFAVIGGPYVHLTQTVVAVPAIFALGRRLRAPRSGLTIALILIALPWQDLIENPTVAVLTGVAVVSGILAFFTWRRPLPVALAVVGFVVLGAVERAASLATPAPALDPAAAIAPVAQGSRLAEASWAAFMSVTQSGNVMLYSVTHLATWAGLALMVVLATRSARAVA